MIEDILNNIINTTINSFDFTFCIIINIITYTTIKTIIDIKPSFNLTTWHKRGIFIISAAIVTIVYYLIGSDTKVLFNSIILAPVSWSWLFKPICNHFKIDYKHKLNGVTDNKDFL